MKFRTKIFLIFSILAIIPLLVLAGFSYIRYERTIYQQMDDISSQLFENATETANSTLNSIVDTTNFFNFYYHDGTRAIENLDLFMNLDQKPEIFEFYHASKSYDRICQNRMYSDENIYGIYLITPSGYVFSYTNEINGSIRTDFDFEGAAWYQRVKKLDGRLFISTVDAHEMFTGKKRSVFFSQYLKDVYTHETAGILVVDCNPAIFDLSSANTMPDITLLTIDNTETDDVLYTNYDEISCEFEESDRKVMRGSLRLSPLRLTAVVDYGSLFREFNVTIVLLLLISVVCIGGFLVTAYLVSRHMVKPLEDLSRQMRSQKAHPMEFFTQHMERNDEIGTLYNGYNTMVESLNASVKQDYHDKLVVLDAQMKSLEARINSHFLFNTLESINSMAELEENQQISTMSLALGNMFRYTLKTQSELVTVEEELGHVRDYVSIQQIRFDYRFRLEIRMEEEFRQQRVLKLILQPLVENALYHGLKYCSCGDTITVAGQLEEGLLTMDVRDNGQGIEEERLLELQQNLTKEASFTELGHRNKHSIGLTNIHSRIELYYGRGYGLSVTSQPGQWTNIRIKLPVLR